MARAITPPADLVRDDSAFIAFDVETANSDAASICQIGFARVAGGVLVANWSWLIHPQSVSDWLTMAHRPLREFDRSEAVR